MLSVIGQADGTLTIAADGEMPERDIPVYIILLGYRRGVKCLFYLTSPAAQVQAVVV